MGTRDQILAACTELIAEQGLAALSLRQVADRVGIRAPSIYAHFAGKEDMLAAAQATAAQRLAQAMAAYDDPTADARGRVIATSLGYLHFAREQPHFFSLLFMHSPSGRKDLSQPPPQGSAYGYLLERVRAFVGEGGGELEFLAFGLWSLVHGAAVLRHTHLKDFVGPIDAGVEASLGALLDGWPVPARARRTKGTHA